MTTVDAPPTSTPVPTVVPAELEGRERIRLVLILGALIALGPLTIDMYLPSLPSIADDFAVSSATAQLTLTGTLAGLALGQLIVGPLSDVFGRRRPLIAGTVVHVVASLLCYFAPSIAVLGLLRGLQGLGAAAAAVVAMAVVRDLFAGRGAATVLSRLMLVMGVAPILAPSVGGALLIAVSWRGVFLALAALGLLMVAMSALALPETLPPSLRRHSGLLPVLRTYGQLLRDRQFTVLVLVSGLGMSALFAYVAGSSFVLQDQFGLTQQQFGLVFAAGAIALIGATQLNVRLLDRWTPQHITLGALAASSIAGIALVVVSAADFGGLIGFVIPLWFVLGALGFVLPNAPALALSRHGEAAGTAAAVLGAVQFGFGALIAPVVGLLGNDSLAMASAMAAGGVIAFGALLAVSRSGVGRA